MIKLIKSIVTVTLCTGLAGTDLNRIPYGDLNKGAHLDLTGPAPRVIRSRSSLDCCMRPQIPDGDLDPDRILDVIQRGDAHVNKALFQQVPELILEIIKKTRDHKTKCNLSEGLLLSIGARSDVRAELFQQVPELILEIIKKTRDHKTKCNLSEGLLLSIGARTDVRAELIKEVLEINFGLARSLEMVGNGNNEFKFGTTSLSSPTLEQLKNVSRFALVHANCSPNLPIQVTNNNGVYTVETLGSYPISELIYAIKKTQKLLESIGVNRDQVDLKPLLHAHSKLEIKKTSDEIKKTSDGIYNVELADRAPTSFDQLLSLVIETFTLCSAVGVDLHKVNLAPLVDQITGSYVKDIKDEITQQSDVYIRNALEQDLLRMTEIITSLNINYTDFATARDAARFYQASKGANAAIKGKLGQIGDLPEGPANIVTNFVKPRPITCNSLQSAYSLKPMELTLDRAVENIKSRIKWIYAITNMLNPSLDQTSHTKGLIDALLSESEYNRDRHDRLKTAFHRAKLTPELRSFLTYDQVIAIIDQY